MHWLRGSYDLRRLGIKVWIMKGEVYGKRELSPRLVCPKSQVEEITKARDQLDVSKEEETTIIDR